ncbi:protein reticulata-related 4 [Quercus suber]|uniref:Protein reticulata-related 4 n=1 Tax=Quercus suber TaxID=58331 RepID=A0AAW0IVA4_QUESU
MHVTDNSGTRPSTSKDTVQCEGASKNKGQCEGTLEDTSHDLYGPWVVVARKRSGNKVTKKGVPTDQNPIKNMGLPIDGISDSLKWEGKRKGSGDCNLNGAHIQKVVQSISKGPKETSQRSSRESNGPTRQEPNFGLSVKGKKGIARGRASLSLAKDVAVSPPLSENALPENHSFLNNCGFNSDQAFKFNSSAGQAHQGASCYLIQKNMEAQSSRSNELSKAMGMAVVWNCRGALKPNFQNYVQDIVQLHDPAMLVVMETHVGGERAREARVTHLTKCHSDHCLVLLEMHPQNRARLNRPFIFQKYWLLSISFPKVVSQAWNQSPHLQKAIDNFAVKANEWNMNNFGNIFIKKNRIKAQLNGVQGAMAIRPSSSLVKLKNKLIQELDTILNQEHELWALKSRVNWMVQGNRNTAFYHVSTLVRRNRNHITAIKNSMGDWIKDEEEVMEFVRKGFCDIYSTSHVLLARDLSQNTSPILTVRSSLPHHHHPLPSTSVSLSPTLLSLHHHNNPTRHFLTAFSIANFAISFPGEDDNNNNGNSGGGGSRGGGGDEGSSAEDKNREEALMVLAEAGRSLKNLPKDLAAAIEVGRVLGTVVSRFLELEKSPMLRWLMQFSAVVVM